VKIDTIIFDMDGVITTEEKYWACARLAVWELVTQTLELPDAFGDAIHSESAREAVCSDTLIYALKSRAVNSNWDITYVLACLYIAALPGVTVENAADIEGFLQAVRETQRGQADWPAALEHFLAETPGMEGRALIEEAGLRLENVLSFASSPLTPAPSPREEGKGKTDSGSPSLFTGEGFGVGDYLHREDVRDDGCAAAADVLRHADTGLRYLVGARLAA